VVEKASTTTTHAMMMVVQEMTWLYVEQAPSDDFIPLAITIETYGVSSFSFVLLFDHLWIVHFHSSSTIVFSPLNVCLLL
jgi:hypothetical protein